MPAGQALNVLSCAASTPLDGALSVSSSLLAGVCPNGLTPFVVPAYVPFVESASYVDGLMSSFDPAIAGGLFGFGWGIVVLFYVLGLKGSVLIKPFWSGWR